MATTITRRPGRAVAVRPAARVALRPTRPVPRRRVVRRPARPRRHVPRRHGLRWRGQQLPGWVVVAGVLGVLLVAGGGIKVGHDIATAPPAGALACAPDGQPVPVAGFGPDQMRNAAVIVAVGREMRVPERGQVVALATAMQEATLRNLNYGDRDSLGLFQQRPSMGWGSPAQVTNPRYAARKFYEHLVKVPGWQSMPLTVAAQTVQRSGFPAAYAKWEDDAEQVVAAVSPAITCTERS